MPNSLLISVVNNRDLFLDNVELYTTKTRNSNNLHPPLSHLKKTKKESIMLELEFLIICWLP